MSDALYDQFEELTPTGRTDVPVRQLLALLGGLPKPSDETRIALHLLEQFESAKSLQLPAKDGLYLWLGYCVGGFDEWPRREDFFLFGLERFADSVKGYATGVEDPKDSKPTKLRSVKDVERINTAQVDELVEMLRGTPKNEKSSDGFSTLSYTDGPSFAFSPGLSARFFIRQRDDKLIFVQPSRLGGWYGELWPKAV